MNKDALQRAPVHSKQGKALRLLNHDEVVEYILFGGGAEGGKSFVGWLWLVNSAIGYPDTRWFCGREELKRLRNTTLTTFYKICKMYGIRDSRDFKYNGQDHYIQFPNGSRIDLLELKGKPSDPLFQRFGSSEYTGGWIEEAGEVPFGAFDMLKTRIGRQNNDRYNLLPGKMFLTCNPAKNWLYTTFYLPWKQGELPEEYAFIQSLYNDNKYREPGADKRLGNLKKESQRQRLKYGNWEYADDPDALVTYEELMQLRSVDKRQGLNYCGADIARYGDDKNSFAKFNGNWLEKVASSENMDTSETADELKRFMTIESISAENTGIDTVGLGAGTYDSLKKMGKTCVEIISGAKATASLKGDGDNKTYEFKNLRSQMWWQFREDCKNDRICIDSSDDELLTDLTAPRYKIVNEKVIQVESKDKIKERLGRSPDKGDAVVYANAMRNGIVKITKKVESFLA